MAITSDLDNIVKWFEEEVCPDILLKVPDDKVNDGGYNVQTAHPAAFAMYIPTQDRKPPDVAAPIPSLCVQLLKGKHAPAQHIGQMTIQLALATWNPGQHGSEMAVPEQDPQALGGVKYRKEPSENFKRNLEGWRDVWSFTDKVLQAIENTEYIAGLRLVKENGIEYGPFTEDGALVSYYPYWFCWVQFTLEHAPSASARYDAIAEAEWVLDTYEPRVEVEGIDFEAPDAQGGDFSTITQIKLREEEDNE